MTHPLKIVFAGTPEFAAYHLHCLLNSEHQVCAVYTQPDRPAGRGKRLQASPVKVLAQQHDIPVLQPDSLKGEDAQQTLAAFEADVMIVVAYGLLLPQSILDTPAQGCLNVHGSILPRWRGAAPIQRAIEAGDLHSGVTIMQMEAGLDTGPMLLKTTLEISHLTGGQLHDALMKQGGDALLQVLADLPAYLQQAEPQADAQACYAAKLTKQEALIDWQQPASVLLRKINAFNPWPVCYTLLNDSPLKIWQASVCDYQGTAQPGEIVQADKSGIVVATGAQALCLTQLQPANSRAMSAADLLNSRKDALTVGTCLGTLS